jgi:uridine phosphorylase
MSSLVYEVTGRSGIAPGNLQDILILFCAVMQCCYLRCVDGANDIPLRFELYVLVCLPSFYRFGQRRFLVTTIFVNNGSGVWKQNKNEKQSNFEPESAT